MTISRASSVDESASAASLRSWTTTERRAPGISSCLTSSRARPSPPALADRTATWTLAMRWPLGP
eukprot:3070624-Prymnesium_polylepis.1